jgi:hypothetical protein
VRGGSLYRVLSEGKESSTSDEAVRGVYRVYRDVEDDRAVARAAFAAAVSSGGCWGWKSGSFRRPA